MSKKLMIVESPTKARVFKKGKYLPKDFIVEASKGHVIDLPKKSLGIDVDNDFTPKYTIIDGREKELNKLNTLAKQCDEVYLAPDPDREGEAIAWHLKNYLQENNKDLKFYRVTYNEINKKAVNLAIENPSKIDERKVDAQQARRVLDRVVGYKLSPLLWKWLKRGMSVGRVQTVGLELVCMREEEIQNFKSQTYYNLLLNGFVKDAQIEAVLNKYNGKLLPKIEKNIRGLLDEELINKLKDIVDNKVLKIKKIDKKIGKTSPNPPFITSTLQQAASSRFGFSPAKTMKIAQELYEGVELEDGVTGLITYMRTDSFNISKDAIDVCRELIDKNFGKEYLPEKMNVYKRKQNAQEAHEAIRPVDVTKEPNLIAKYLSPDQKKLYTLIWQRFVASQMSSAVNENLTVTIVEEKDKLEFVSKFTKETFDGFRKVYSDNREKYIKSFPNINEGDDYVLNKSVIEKKETKPPARYSEASLIKALEENGVGRPSTYATIITTLKSRKYVESKSKKLIPTNDGMAVYNWVKEHVQELFKIDFTAKMESQLDEIESGKLQWKKMVKEYYDIVEQFIKNSKPPQANIDDTKIILDAFENFDSYDEPKKIGRRVYDDKKFIDSIKKSFKKKGEITQKQYNSLIKIYEKYKETLGVELDVESVGNLNIENSDNIEKIDNSNFIEMINLIKNSKNISKETEEILDSLLEQLDSNREMSYKQKMLLNNIFIKTFKDSNQMNDYVKKYNLNEKDVEASILTPKLINDLTSVTEWTITKSKNGKERNEKDFFESLKSQYEKSGVLSTKQFYYLSRMHKKYFKNE